MNSIHPLIICGGNGTRLWPMSRAQSPKQFQRVGGENSLTFFQATVERHRGPEYSKPFVVSSVTHRRTVNAQLSQIDSDAQIIYEPMGRNTGPAVLSAAIKLAETDPDAIMLVVPADHVIEGDMNTTIFSMIDAARDGKIITFGIVPRYAETGFGYIADGGKVDGYDGLHHVDGFVEKPPMDIAKHLVDSKSAYWASGISMFTARTIIDEYKKFDRPTYRNVNQAVERGNQNATGLVLDRDFFRQAVADPTESVVFEKTDRIRLAPLDVDWNDVGSWTAMYGVSQPNEDGNVFQGDVIAVGTTNSMIRAETRLVAVVGMSDVIVIDTADAVLITKAGACQDVKRIAEQLKAGKRPEIERHATSEFEWGKTKQLVNKNRFNVSSVELKQGSAMQMEPAFEREAIVVRGEVQIASGSRNTMVGEGERVVLDNSRVSKVSNFGEETAELVMLTVESRPDVIDANREEKARPALTADTGGSGAADADKSTRYA